MGVCGPLRCGHGAPQHSACLPSSCPCLCSTKSHTSLKGWQEPSLSEEAMSPVVPVAFGLVLIRPGLAMVIAPAFTF